MADASAHGVKLTARRKNLLQMALASREEDTAPVIKKTPKPGAVEPDPIRGLIEAAVDGRAPWWNMSRTRSCGTPSRCRYWKRVEWKPSSVGMFFPTPQTPWYVPDSVKKGYEISFTRHFYKPQPLRHLEQIRADILALEHETEGLLGEIVGQF